MAVHLASIFDGEIVSADSRQIYRFMDIGTGKPTAAQRAGIAHHLIDIKAPDEEFNVAMFLDLANAAVCDVQARNKLPILVGGTGQYIWALLEGWQGAQVRADHELRQKYEEAAAVQGPEYLHNMLTQIDPESAQRIDYRNVRRVIRALEIHHATGSTASSLRRKTSGMLHHMVIGIDIIRAGLYRRIDARVHEMLTQGLVQEVESLLADGYGPHLPSMSSIGYQEIIKYLHGDLSLEEASQSIKYNTHRLARHQNTWFRRNDPRITWLTAGPDLESEASDVVRTFLSERGSCDRMVPATGEASE